MNIKELRERYDLSQQALAEATGIPRARIGKWEEGKGKPKTEDHLKLTDFFAGKAKGSGEELRTTSQTAGEGSKEVSYEVLKVLVESNKGLVETNRDLVQSNRVLAESNRTLSDAHLIIAKTHDELLQMSKRSTADAYQGTHEGVQTKLTKILGYIAQIGSGKLPWKSAEEAIAVLSSEFAESQPVSSSSKVGIPSD